MVFQVFFYVPLLAVLQPVVRNSSAFYRYTSAMSVPRTKYCQDNHPDQSLFI